MKNEDESVVVTGVALVSSLGLTASKTWDVLLSGKHGTLPIKDFDAKGFECRVAAQVQGLDHSSLDVHPRDARIMDKYMMKKVLNVDIKYEFPKISHKDAMDKYGCDKPDLRFGLELTDVTDIAKSSDFNVFNKAEKVKCINPEDKFSRNEIDDLIDFAISIGSKGMAWMRVTEKGLESNIAKFFNKDTQKKLIEKTKAKKGTILFFIADNEKNTNEILSKIRVEVGKGRGCRER